MKEQQKYSISVIIPNRNGQKLLQSNLSAVKNAVGEVEIIVVDDASSDDSRTYLAAHHKDIIVIEHKVQKGFASTVNTGARRATGDIVVLLNTDVVPKKELFKKMLPHFEDASVFAVGCMDRSHEHGKIALRGSGGR